VHRLMTTQDQTSDRSLLRWLLKRTKQGKGVVQMDVVEEAFGLMPGWSIVETTTFLLLASYNGADVLRTMLKTWATQWNVGHISGGYSLADVTEFMRIGSDLAAAQEDFLRQVEIVETEGKTPDGIAVPGRLYSTAPEPVPPNKYNDHLPGFQVKRMWLGVRGWIITAPDGVSATLPNPITRNGDPYDANFLEGFTKFWTFCYKHGLATTSKAALDRQDQEAIVLLNAPLAERKLIAERRIILPEVEKLLRDMVESKFQEVAAYWTKQHEEALNIYLRIQEAAWESEKDKKFPQWNDYKLFQEQPMLGWFRSFIGQATEPDLTRGMDMGWVARRTDVTKIAEKFGHNVAWSLRESFVHKNAYKLSLIVRAKGNLGQSTVTRINRGDDFGGEMRFTFKDGSKFTVRNKTVFKLSPLQKPYEQYPTTFHNVVMPDGSAMGTPSEKRMIEVFANA
jgi:hypothetical protein